MRPVDFSDGIDDRHPSAYQVKRAEFDDLLLRHAEESGAEVREETAVSRVLFEGSTAVGVVAATRGGPEEEIRARVVVDASGQDAFLSRQLGNRRFDKRLKRAALFAHYEGIRWPEDQRPGDILLPIDRGVWYWIIPFSDGTCERRRRLRAGTGAAGGGREDVARRPVRLADDALGAHDRVPGRIAPDESRSSGSPTTRPPRRARAATDGCSSETRRPSWTPCSRPASFSRWPWESARPGESTARSKSPARFVPRDLAPYGRETNRLVAPIPPVRLRLLRSRLLRGVLLEGALRSDARVDHHDPLGRSREDPARGPGSGSRSSFSRSRSTDSEGAWDSGRARRSETEAASA